MTRKSIVFLVLAICVALVFPSVAVAHPKTVKWSVYSKEVQKNHVLTAKNKVLTANSTRDVSQVKVRFPGIWYRPADGFIFDLTHNNMSFDLVPQEQFIINLGQWSNYQQYVQVGNLIPGVPTTVTVH